MGETIHLFQFVPGEERRRFHLITNRGKLIKLLVQYETFVNGKWFAVIRYDNEHGYIHKDILNDKEKVIDKIPLGKEIDYKSAINVATKDIAQNWQDHKKEFLKFFKRPLK